MTTPTKNYWQLSARGYRDSYALWLPSGRSDGVGGRASRFCSTGFRAVDRALDFVCLILHTIFRAAPARDTEINIRDTTW